MRFYQPPLSMLGKGMGRGAIRFSVKISEGVVFLFIIHLPFDLSFLDLGP